MRRFLCHDTSYVSRYCLDRKTSSKSRRGKINVTSRPRTVAFVVKRSHSWLRCGRRGGRSRRGDRTKSDRVDVRGAHQPRSSGCTKASSAGRSPGSRSAACLRPSPAGVPGPAAQRRSPAHRPAATPSVRGPQRPGPLAGSRHDPAHGPRPPISSRLCRSPRCGKIDPDFAARTRPASSLLPIPHQHAAYQEATSYFFSSPSWP
jgi:hypothetical protein